MKKIVFALAAALLCLTVQAQQYFPFPPTHPRPPRVPEYVVFAGDTVMLNTPDRYERMDRELIAFTHSHTVSTLMLKRSKRIFSVVVPIMKANGLTEKKMINAIYKTADKGVPVTLIIRGPCCLDLKGHPNIQVRSIVGRFLEHARVYCFTHQGDPVVFLSSADLMTRNLDKRVELMFPIEEPQISARIQQELRFEMEDNLKAWELRKNGSYYRAERKPPYMNAQEQDIQLADPLYSGNKEGDIQ